MTRRPGARRTLSKEIDVPGAADARRIELTVPAGDGFTASRIRRLIDNVMLRCT